jgi:DNA invertase Pin-like site-specific DNA recombinase
MDEKDKAMWVHTLWDPLEKIDQSPLHSKKDGIKVAAYCRVSLDSLNLSKSLESQVSYYTHYINNRKNWKFVGIYFDNLVSGRKASLRQGFTRMLRHCDEGKIDLILVKDVSRFSRNAKELIEIVERLKEINVTVYFEVENIESTRSDTTYLLKTFASIAQGTIEASSQAIEWGHEKRMMKGKANIGNLYGYEKTKTEDGTVITVNEKQAHVIREIYKMYLDGMNYNSIATELARRGIKTFYGNDLWGTRTISSILSNISYTGNVLTRKITVDLMSNKRRSSEGVRDQYFIENHHPPIISMEVYEQVQERINKNKGTSFPKTFRPNPLTKRVRCGNCGQNFRRNTVKPWDYFKCVTVITNMSLCPTPTIREDVMVKIMLEAFKERFDTEGLKFIKNLQRMLIRINQNDHFEFHRLKALTQIQLAKSLRGTQYTDEDIDRMEKAYQSFEERLAKIEDDRQYRLAAITWLDKVENFNTFEKQATIEYMRAWILEMVIYSKEDYIIYWIDGEETKVGSCIPIEPKREEPLIETQIKGDVVVEKIAEVEIEKQSHIASEKGGDRSDRDSEEGAKMIAEKKLEPNLMVKTIKRQLSNSVIIQTSVPAVREEKLKVAAYVRVSSEHEQQEISLKTQYSYYLYLILKNPRYTLADIYMDDGKSGRTAEGRPEFKRMIEDCKASKIDLIITKSISRFARNTVDTLTYLKMLKNLEPQTIVWFERENIFSNDENSSVLINLLSALSQEESINIGEAIAWGKRSLAQRGIVRLARIGYGYKSGENKEWIINEEEAKVVRRIYNEYESGKRISDIRNMLTSEEIPTPGGQRKWCDTTIERILSSEIYRGNYIYQRFHNGFTLVKERVKNTGELPMYFIEAHHEGIIDSNQWERVQNLTKAKKKRRQEGIEKYPEDHGKNEAFTKKLYCGKCGSMVGYVRTIIRKTKNREVRHWRCYQALEGDCDCSQLSQEYIEENFSQLLMDIKFNPAIDEYLHSFMESLKLKPQEIKQREILEQTREELNQKLYKAVEDELGKKGKDAKLVDHLTEEIMKIREKLMTFTEREEQLVSIEEEINELRKTLEICKDKRKDAIGYYRNAPEFQPEIFERFIEKGTVFGDGRITYQFKSGFEWGMPLNRSDFKEREKRRAAAKKALEKKEFLKGPEVRELLKFCEEPKSIKEMREYLPRYLTNYNYNKFIVNPLMEKGLIKQTRPDKPTSRLQKYYSVEKGQSN